MQIYWIKAQAPRRVLALVKHLGIKAECIEMDMMAGALKTRAIVDTGGGSASGAPWWPGGVGRCFVNVCTGGRWSEESEGGGIAAMCPAASVAMNRIILKEGLYMPAMSGRCQAAMAISERNVESKIS